MLHCDLILDDRVKDRVGLDIGQFYARDAVELFCHADAKLLIERKPLLWIGRVIGVVRNHYLNVPANV